MTLFELLAGEKPFEELLSLNEGDFDGEDDGAAGGDSSWRYSQMMDCELEADMRPLSGVSAAGVACIRRMLAKDYQQRPTASECSTDDWFGGAASEDAYFSR